VLRRRNVRGKCDQQVAGEIDQFGQHRDKWPAKAESLEALRKDWDRERPAAARGDFAYTSYGGFINSSIKGAATGFFRTEKIDGRWWFVDPDGHLFLSAGSDVITPWMSTPAEGRHSIFAAMPPEELARGVSRPGARAFASFYAWNLSRRFGADWYPKWVDFTVRRMKAWGINTIGNWSFTSANTIFADSIACIV
jgi:hypothetical protein